MYLHVIYICLSLYSCFFQITSPSCLPCFCTGDRIDFSVSLGLHKPTLIRDCLLSPAENLFFGWIFHLWTCGTHLVSHVLTLPDCLPFPADHIHLGISLRCFSFLSLFHLVWRSSAACVEECLLFPLSSPSPGASKGGGPMQGV